MTYKKVNDPMVLGLKDSFHGVGSWGFLTDRCMGTAARMEFFPKNQWRNLNQTEIKKYFQKNNLKNLAAVIVEPIQCTSGDIYLKRNELIEVQNLCRENDVCFIVDEVQTGFGVTGEMWYSDYLNLEPDILVFGKKSQIMGIAVTEKYAECITNPLRKLEVTFNGDLIDTANKCRYNWYWLVWWHKS